MFETTQAMTLFPTVCWIHDLPAAEAAGLNRDLEASIMALLGPNSGVPAGDKWQTSQDLHLRPEFQGLVQLIQAAGQGVVSYLKLAHSAIEITGCWANINPPGMPHSIHTHPNNLISGVYYVKAAPGADQINFYDPRPQARVLAPKITEGNVANALQSNVDIKPGRLICFPAWLEHGVPPNRSRAERISISFNLMQSDFTRKVSPPKWKGVGGAG
ncbi:MAG: TIGR02466 family protein [Kiloniellales bacterium]